MLVRLASMGAMTKSEAGLISKEQAHVISEQLISASKGNRHENESILRRIKNPIAVAIIVPFFGLLPSVSSFLRSHAEIPVWFYLIAGLACITVIYALSVLIYQAFTPLLKVDHDALISYGMAPWKKRKLPLSEISAVTFHLPVMHRFWRPVRLITLQLADVEYRIWLPSNRPSPVLPTRKMLQANFKEKYSEIEH
jgi:hypothetical protein